ncbi:MAG: biotin/lipoyl-binding protein, partial [Eubacterium sp.]|nr:biotin/lipoyl-binding protein [Eubacterium sp.]
KMETIRKNKKNRIIIAVVIVAIIAAVSAAIAYTAIRNSVTEVSLYNVGTSDIYETVTATGQVSSGAVKEYKVGAVATVKEVKVKVGDKVKKGDLLATFDTSSFDSQIAQMQSSYNQAKASYNESLAAQKEAKKNLAATKKKIAELEKENKKLQKEANNKKTTAKASSTTRPSVPSTTQPNSANNTNPVITLPSNLPSNLFPSNSGDIQIDPSVIAGIDINDMEAVMAAVSSTQSKLAANEIMLAAYYAQEQMYSSLASDNLVSAKKELMNTTRSALNSLQDAQQEMAAGWKAAFDGTITECNIFPEEQTSLLANGITLQNMNNKIVTISLGEYDIHKVKVDMPAKIKTAYGEYIGKVISKDPVATGGSSSSIIDSVGSSMGISGLSSLTQAGAGVQVQITVDNPDENIIIGFDAEVEISVGEHIGITTVPSQAMVLDKTGSYVFVYNEEEKMVTKTLIETGASSVSEYEVLSGVKVGDKIVVAPQSTFEDSFEARVKEDA